MSVIKDLEKVIGGKPIEDIAPLLVVTVARMLVLDAGGDMPKLAMLVAKFTHHLTSTINDMVDEDDAGTRH
jgi:hypothetical protein